jgi:hypothetical protein
LLNSADISCRHNFLDKLTKECTQEDIDAGNKRLEKYLYEKDPQTVVSVIDSVCLSSLRDLSYEQQTGFMDVVLGQERLSEESEMAVLRLMNAIDSRNYSSFFEYLESDNNRRIKYLVEEIDDKSIYFWDGNNYTDFIGALVWMYKVAPESYASKFEKDDAVSLLGRVFDLSERKENISLYISHDYSERQDSIVYNTYYIQGDYDQNTGNITVVEKGTQVTGYFGERASSSSFKYDKLQDIILSNSLSPLTPVIIKRHLMKQI